MKIGGVDPKTLPSVEILVLPRGDQVLVLRARGVSDFEDFNKFVPEPKPPVAWNPQGEAVSNFDDKSYKDMLTEFMRRRWAYTVVKSLQPSEITWDTVQDEVPGTWANWEQDLKNSGLSQNEILRINALVMQANSLDEAKIKWARERFLRGPKQASDTSTSLPIEQVNTPSGEPVSE